MLEVLFIMATITHFPIIEKNRNGEFNIYDTFITKINEYDTNLITSTTSLQLKNIQFQSTSASAPAPAPATQSQDDKRKLVTNYVTPEMLILNSKIYEAFVRRENYIFSYLQNYEEFYRMSQYYLSHENPNIRSINKLLRTHLAKTEGFRKEQFVQELQTIYGLIESFQKENVMIILQNMKTYIENEKTIFQEKNIDYENLERKINKLDTSLGKTKTPQALYDEIEGDEKKVKDIKLLQEIIYLTYKLDISKKETLEKLENIITTANANRNKTEKKVNGFTEILQKIDEIQSLYEEDNLLFQEILDTLTDYFKTFSIEDENLKKEKKEKIEKKLNEVYIKSKTTLDKELQDLITSIFNTNKSLNNGTNINSNFHLVLFQILRFIKCFEIDILRTMYMSPLNDCDPIDIKELYKTFQKNVRKNLQKVKDNYQTLIKKIEQSKKENVTLMDERKNEYRDTNADLTNKEKQLNEKKSKKEELERRKTRESRKGAPSTRFNEDISTLDGDIKKSGDEILNLKNKKTNLEMKLRTNKRLDDEYISLLTSKENEAKSKIAKMDSLFNSMASIFPKLNQTYQLLNQIKDKNDKLAKRKNTNRLLEGLESDTLFKEINNLFEVSKEENSTNAQIKYKLKIKKNAQLFKMRVPVLLKYFSNKLNFYKNRKSILSMFKLNANVIPVPTNQSIKELLPMKMNDFKKLFNTTNLIPKSNQKNVISTSAITNTSVPSYPASTTQTKYGVPSPQSYSPSLGGANMKKTDVKSNVKTNVEFITVLDKILDTVRTKESANPVYANRMDCFVKYLDAEDERISNEIMLKLLRVQRIKKAEYQFAFAEQIKFITRRMYRMELFIQKLKEPKVNLEAIYMTDLILMYFSLHYILSNFLDCIIKQNQKILIA
jgi:hypothetical protein